MALDLYREEALDAQRQRQYGTGLRVRSPSLPFLTAAAALVAAAVVTFLIVGQYTRKEHVSGYLAPTLGLIKVYTPQQGTVVEKRVTEGQSVKQGDVLLIVSSERATASTHEAQAAMLRELRDRRDSLRAEQQKQAGIDELAADELRKRIAALGAELAQARAQFSLAAAAGGERPAHGAPARGPGRREVRVGSHAAAEAGGGAGAAQPARRAPAHHHRPGA